MNSTTTTKTHSLSTLTAVAVFVASLNAAPVAQADEAFELRLHTRHLSGAQDLEKGRVDKAIDRLSFEYRKAGLSKPDILPSAIALCAAYVIKSDHENATIFCDKAVQANSANALARNNRGVLNVSKGHLAAAEADFSRALEQRPNFSEAKRNLERLQQLIAIQTSTRDESILTAR